MTPPNSSFTEALNTAIDQLGKDAEAVAVRIEALKADIQANIQSIVDGANKAGAATIELIIGVVTTIANAKPDKPGSDKKDGGDSPPSTDFAVSAIAGATDGVAETSKARAEQNANNKELAEAYQNLAKIDALIAVAKVVNVQNELFTTAVGALNGKAARISDNWGRPPVAPPASSVAAGFAGFSDGVNAITSDQEANQLLAQANFAATDWDLLNRKLDAIKAELVASGA